MFSSTNEVMGTSRSRIKDLKYQFAGKTGNRNKKNYREGQRIRFKTFGYLMKKEIMFHIAFGPYKNPRYALSIIVEHGGNGSTTAAPMAKELFKLVIDRHQLRQTINNKKYMDI